MQNPLMQRLVALLTCHNRRDKTLACLRALHENLRFCHLSVDVLLVDDGSSDGTAASVAERFPSVHLIQGDGTLFWAGGMRVAFQEALARDYDYYLFLNDDTLLYPNALECLWRAAGELKRASGSDAVAVGSTRNAQTGATTYGGLRRMSRWHPLNLQLINPSDASIPCDTMNTNCVLVPRVIARAETRWLKGKSSNTR